MTDNLISNEFAKPRNFDEAMRLAEMIAKSDLAPNDFKRKPESVLIAMQMGAEVGLAPMQALQNIAVINGRPSIWGDAMLALAQRHPAYIDCIETFDKETMTASCTVIKKNEQSHTVTFSHEEAKIAGLLSKDVWKKYEPRMLQMRARGFALRNKFADALRGLISIEEARDYKKPISKTDNRKEVIEGVIDECCEESKQTETQLTQKENEKETQEQIDAGQLKIAQSLMNSREIEEVKCFEFFKIKSLKELKANQFNGFVALLSGKKLKNTKKEVNNNGRS